MSGQRIGFLKRYFLFFFVLLFFSGCATLGAVGGGFITMITTLVKLPFHLLSKIVDIINVLPRPPGVF